MQSVSEEKLLQVLPNSLLLHGLHFLSTGDHAVYNLLLFIGEVWTRTGAWLHGPVAPVSQAYSAVEGALYDLTIPITHLHAGIEQ